MSFHRLKRKSIKVWQPSWGPGLWFPLTGAGLVGLFIIGVTLTVGG